MDYEEVRNFRKLLIDILTEDAKCLLDDYFVHIYKEAIAEAKLDLLNKNINDDDIVEMYKKGNFDEVLTKIRLNKDVEASDDECDVLWAWRCRCYLYLNRLVDLKELMEAFATGINPTTHEEEINAEMTRLLKWINYIQNDFVKANVKDQIKFIEKTEELEGELSITSEIVESVYLTLLCIDGQAEKSLKRLMSLMTNKDSVSDYFYTIIYIVDIIFLISKNDIIKYGYVNFKQKKFNSSGLRCDTLHIFTFKVFKNFPLKSNTHLLVLNAGQHLYKQGHLKEGVETFKIILDKIDEGLQVDNQVLQDIYIECGKALIELGRVNEAFKMLSKLHDTQLSFSYRTKILKMLYEVSNPIPDSGNYTEYLVSTEEQKLADDLRRYCDKNGKEIRRHLEKCAHIILELGKFYLSECQNRKGIDQKLCIIRCSALLNGARVRYEILNEEGKNKNITEKISFSEELLTELGVIAQTSAFSASIENLYTIGKNISRERISLLRKKTEESFFEVNRIDEDDMHDKEEAKINLIRHKMENVTLGYLSIMNEIAQHCAKILGEAPCKYALVGLGSLARHEITPYSDFEHVIILDDIIEDSTDYKNILEYFRWFTVIFQLIVINFGETFIKSVGIKSLNDTMSPDKSKDWFYDAITPVGIAFDGMVRHASLNPLGAQEPTPQRPHVVEFIKTASKMAAYLTFEEHLKNGYYIKEILGRTCYVFGDQEVYQLFESKKNSILSEISYEDFQSNYNNVLFKEYSKEYQIRSDVLPDQSKLLNENKNASVYNCFNFRESREISVKHDLYRPAVTYIATLSRIYHVPVPNSFEIVDFLESKHIINSSVAHDFRFLVAVVCELRMRMYVETKSERNDKIGPESLVKWIGKSGIVNTFVIMHFLMQITRNIFNVTIWDGDARSFICQKLRCLEVFGKIDDIISTGEKWLNINGGIETMQYNMVNFKLQLVYFFIGEAFYWKALGELEHDITKSKTDFESSIKYLITSLYISEKNQLKGLKLDKKFKTVASQMISIEGSIGKDEMLSLISSSFSLVIEILSDVKINMGLREIEKINEWIKEFKQKYLYSKWVDNISIFVEGKCFSLQSEHTMALINYNEVIRCNKELLNDQNCYVNFSITFECFFSLVAMEKFKDADLLLKVLYTSEFRGHYTNQINKKFVSFKDHLKLRITVFHYLKYLISDKSLNEPIPNYILTVTLISICTEFIRLETQNFLQNLSEEQKKSLWLNLKEREIEFTETKPFPKYRSSLAEYEARLNILLKIFIILNMENKFEFVCNHYCPLILIHKTCTNKRLLFSFKDKVSATMNVENDLVVLCQLMRAYYAVKEHKNITKTMTFGFRFEKRYKFCLQVIRFLCVYEDVAFQNMEALTFCLNEVIPVMLDNKKFSEAIVTLNQVKGITKKVLNTNYTKNWLNLTLTYIYPDIETLRGDENKEFSMLDSLPDCARELWKKLQFNYDKKSISSFLFIIFFILA